MKNYNSSSLYNLTLWRVFAQTSFVCFFGFVCFVCFVAKASGMERGHPNPNTVNDQMNQGMCAVAPAKQAAPDKQAAPAKQVAPAALQQEDKPAKEKLSKQPQSSRGLRGAPIQLYGIKYDSFSAAAKATGLTYSKLKTMVNKNDPAVVLLKRVYRIDLDKYNDHRQYDCIADFAYDEGLTSEIIRDYCNNKKYGYSCALVPDIKTAAPNPGEVAPPLPTASSAKHGGEQEGQGPSKKTKLAIQNASGPSSGPGQGSMRASEDPAANPSELGSTQPEKGFQKIKLKIKLKGVEGPNNNPPKTKEEEEAPLPPPHQPPLGSKRPLEKEQEDQQKGPPKKIRLKIKNVPGEVRS